MCIECSILHTGRGGGGEKVGIRGEKGLGTGREGRKGKTEERKREREGKGRKGGDCKVGV